MKKLLLLAIVSGMTCFARTIEVPNDFPLIQTAIDSSSSGDTVLVAPGTYKELINFNGKNIVLTSHYILNPDSVIIDSTIINADEMGTVVTFKSGEDSTTQLIGFTVTGGEWDASSNKKGFGCGIICSNSSPIIKNCLITNNHGYLVGAVYINNSKVNMKNVTIFDNYGLNYTNSRCGGIESSNSEINLINCIIDYNRGDYGGAFYLNNVQLNMDNVILRNNSGDSMILARNNSRLYIQNSKIYDNSSWNFPVLNLQNSYAFIDNCKIINNKSWDYRECFKISNSEFIIENSYMESGDFSTPALYTQNSDITIYKTSIVKFDDSEAAIRGFDSNIKLIKSTFYGNSSMGDASECIYTVDSDLYIMNCIIWNVTDNDHPMENIQIYFSNTDGKTNDFQIINSNIYKGQEKITVNSSTEMVYENNIYEDPGFVSVEQNDFHINLNSPCIDAGAQLMMNGSDTIFYIPDEDFSGSAPDIGAYEFPYDKMHREYLTTEEFLVNTTTEGDQIEPAIAPLSNNEFVIGWTEIVNNAFSRGKTQILNKNLNYISDENIIAEVNCGDLSLTPLYDKKYVANWKSLDGGTYINMNIIDRGNHNIKIIDSAPFDISNNGGSGKISNTRFITCYSSQYGYNFESDDFDIYFEIFSIDGSTILDKTIANTSIANSQDFPAVASFPNGDFIITWQGESDDEIFDIYAQRFDSTGAKLGNEFMVNTYTENHQRDPYITYLPENKMLIVWESYFQDDSKNGIYGQILDIEGNKVGDEFQINTFNIGDQQEPVATAKSNGEFVVCWQSGFQDGSGNGIFLQQFDNNANKIRTEMQVNSTIDWSQNFPAMTTLDNDDIIICWQSNGQDGDGWSIIAKKLPADYVNSVEDNKIDIADNFILHQNYPNPFNPTTMINYQLPMPNVVQLEVYDILGKKVSTLVSEKQQAGEYSVNFDASGLSSGIYFYRLQVGNEFVETKKMMYLK